MKGAAILLLLSVVALSAYSQQTWESSDGPWFSRIHDFAVGVKNGSVILYAADSSHGSLLKSTDRGDTWSHILGDPGSVVQCVATASSNPDLVYAGVYITAGGLESGVYKSTNGGSSWTRLANQPANLWISRISVNQSNTNIVWVGCFANQLFRVVHRSTDGGQSWEDYEIGGDAAVNNLHVADIALESNPSRVWVATYGEFNNSSKGIWRTLTAGQTWTQEVTGMEADNLRFSSLSIDPANPEVLYAGNVGWFSSSFSPRKVYKTTNATTSCQWSQVYDGTLSAEYSLSDIRVSPHNSSHIYVATGLFESGGIGFLKSTNAGSTWSATLPGPAYSLDAVEVDPLDANILYVGGSGSFYKSTNSGTTWTESNKGSLRGSTAIAQVGNNVVSAHRYLIHMSKNSGATWAIKHYEPNPGLVSAMAFDAAMKPDDNRIALVGGGVESRPTYYLPYVWRTADEGDSWRRISLSHSQPTGIVFGLAFDHNQPSTVYAAGSATVSALVGYVWKSTDAGLTWPTRSDIPVILACIAVGSSTIYVGGESGSGADVYKSTNGGSSWQQVRAGLPGGGNPVNSISVDPSNNQVAYAGTASGMYKTTNSGSSWSAINEGISYTFISSVLVHPINTSVVYAAGLDVSNGNVGHFYRSTNGGSTWLSDLDTGLPASRLNDLAIDFSNPNIILAATNAGAYHISHRWSGSIASSVTWKSGSTYLVDGALTVPEGVSLTIEPGAVVQFDSGAGLLVFGALNAVGASRQPIRFAKAPQGREGKWHGVILRNSTTSTISHAAISGAQYGVGIAVTGDHVQYPSISSCTIRECDVGIYVWGVVQADQDRIIANNHIEACTFGIVTNQGDTKCEPVFEDNTVYRSGNKGLWIERSKPVFLRNRIEESAKEGVLCRFAGNAEFGRNMREASPGLNIIRNNEAIQISAMYASPFLGIADKSSCRLIAGGLNRVYHEDDRVLRVRVQGPGSIVQADKTFWGYPVQGHWFEEEEKGIVIRRCPLKQGLSVEEELLVEAAGLRATGEYEQAIGAYETIVEDYGESPHATQALSGLSETYDVFLAASGDTTLQDTKLSYLQDMARTHANPDVRRVATLELARLL